MDPKRGYSNTDETQQGGFSNEDDNIEHQQQTDLAEETENLPDPAGERHAPAHELEEIVP
ncbi:hypothetical protein C3941_05460 [Kaistia algarum]|uniref:hypothetical protein n=1 Tax=Kaistia algarum TaxID=2083279 RepID=UPI000CE8BC22|nr:hypothetical protein [Kaistia algarum]MCX5515873.1 hypothetical protein [Kaistia algarum]PPE80761.1 hypothetical protein C3941_05460 [Kaistia algarum]